MCASVPQIPISNALEKNQDRSLPPLLHGPFKASSSGLQLLDSQLSSHLAHEQVLALHARHHAARTHTAPQESSTGTLAQRHKHRIGAIARLPCSQLGIFPALDQGLQVLRRQLRLQHGQVSELVLLDVSDVAKRKDVGVSRDSEGRVNLWDNHARYDVCHWLIAAHCE